jgi:tripartite-type tricarboxylate transporter receptor subunit TctC
MYPHTFRSGFAGAALVTLTVIAPPVAAQTDRWPAKPVRIVVTFPPGGASDVVARLLAPRLAGGGPQWLIDNRPGGDGMIGAEIVARAPADGYTLLMANVGPQAIAPAMHRKVVRYDAQRDFTYIAHVGANAHVLLVNPSLPTRTLKEFIALAKKRPGEINFGAGGPINQLTGELLKLKTGIQINYVPYKGAAMVVQELRGGQIPAAVAPLPGNVAQLQAGVLRALAVTSAQRSPLAPDIPTFAELGLPDLIVENWIGIAGPARLNPEIDSRIATHIEKALAAPDLRQRMVELGVTPLFMNSTVFERYVAKEIERWRVVVNAAGVQAE